MEMGLFSLWSVLLLTEQIPDKVQNLFESVVWKHGQLALQLCFECALRTHLLRLLEA